MTELSYTAWDDNRYQWPPPEGWYQASDGKWWPEGYGPMVGQGTTEATAGSDEVAAGGDQGSPGVEEGGIDEDAVSDQATVEFDSGSDAAVVQTVDPGNQDVEEVAQQVAEQGGAPVETTNDAGPNGTSEIAPVGEPDHDVDLDAVASGFAGSTETANPTESAVESESRLSTSSAGMAASGFTSRTEGGASSLGLAGWAETGSSDVRNRVDVAQEYDYSPPEGQSTELLDPIEVSEDEHDRDDAALDSPAVDTSTADTSAEPVDSTLSRLDDLKRQVEQQNFPTHVGGDEATVPVSGAETGGFDPTETLDIDPNDLTLESNPYYGGANETDTLGTSSGTDADERGGADHGVMADAGFEQGYGDPIDTDTEAVGFDSAGQSTVDAPQAAETLQYGYEGESGAPIGEPTVAMATGYRETQTDYSSPTTLSPMSSPPPAPARGRRILFVVIGLLALAVAGVAGYLLFQLQSDDDVVSGGDAGSGAAVGGNAAGPSDTSGQDPGSFSNPHELAGGVRLTVPLGDDTTEVWMLQVREPATSDDVDDELVEVTSRLRVRNDSTSGELTASDLRFVLVSADGSTGTTADESCSSGDDLNRQAAIEPGRDLEGNVCWTVPAAHADGALLGIESIHAGGRVHVELS